MGLFSTEAAGTEASDQRTCRKVPSITLMAVIPTVKSPVIRAGSGELSIQFTGAIPGAAGRSDGSRIAVKSPVTFL